MKRIFFFAILFLTVFTVNAQDSNKTNDLSEIEKKEFQKFAGEQIERFQNYLEIIGKKDEEYKVKDTYQKQALRLFMGRGDPYEDIYGNLQKPVKMGVSRIRGNNKTSETNYPIKTYLKRLQDLPHARVDITAANTHSISELRKVGDHYESVATIFQRFCGYNAEGVHQYCDVTTKSIKIFLIEVEDIKGKKWIVLLGDIEVSETVGIQ